MLCVYVSPFGCSDCHSHTFEEDKRETLHAGSMTVVLTAYTWLSIADNAFIFSDNVQYIPDSKME